MSASANNPAVYSYGRQLLDCFIVLGKLCFFLVFFLNVANNMKHCPNEIMSYLSSYLYATCIVKIVVLKQILPSRPQKIQNVLNTHSSVQKGNKQNDPAHHFRSLRATFFFMYLCILFGILILLFQIQNKIFN